MPVNTKLYQSVVSPKGDPYEYAKADDNKIFFKLKRDTDWKEAQTNSAANIAIRGRIFNEKFNFNRTSPLQPERENKNINFDLYNKVNKKIQAPKSINPIDNDTAVNNKTEKEQKELDDRFNLFKSKDSDKLEFDYKNKLSTKVETKKPLISLNDDYSFMNLKNNNEASTKYNSLIYNNIVNGRYTENKEKRTKIENKINTNSHVVEADKLNLENIYNQGKNYISRQYEKILGAPEKKSTLNNNTLNNDSTYSVTGDTIRIPNDKRRYILPESIDVTNKSFNYRNRGNYNEIDNTDGALITTFQNFKDYNDIKKDNTNPSHTYIGIDSAGKLKVGSINEFKNGDKLTRTFSNTFNGFIKDKSGKIILTGNKDNPGRYGPKIKVLQNGKEIEGSINILSNRDRSTNSYGNITGGRVLVKNDKGSLRLISGSIDNIVSEVEKIQKKSKTPLELYTLDNGSYNRALRTYDKKINPDDLKKYDWQNKNGGGNFLYTKSESSKNNTFKSDDLFEKLKIKTEADLKKLYPNQKVEVVYTGSSRTDAEAQQNLKKGSSLASVSLHSAGAARDYGIYINRKYITNKQHEIYKKTLWKNAEELKLAHLDPNGFGKVDPYHIGLVKETGDGTAFDRLFSQHPELLNKKSVQSFYESVKNKTNFNDKVPLRPSPYNNIVSAYNKALYLKFKGDFEPFENMDSIDVRLERKIKNKNNNHATHK